MSDDFSLEFYCSICGAPFSSPENLNKFKWLKTVKLANRPEYEYVIYDYDSIAFYQPDKNDNPNIDNPVLYAITYNECECVHFECWKLNKKSFRGVKDDKGDPKLLKYQTDDFFDYDKLKTDNNIWMLEDPRCNGKNKRRILARINKINKSRTSNRRYSKKKTKPKNSKYKVPARPTSRARNQKINQYSKLSKDKLSALILKDITNINNMNTLEKIYNLLA